MDKGGLHGHGELPLQAEVNVTSLVDVAFLGMLKPVMWLLGTYAVVGAICGLVRSIQYGKRNRSRSA